mgnify:CR=1 FL=1
MPMLAFTIIVTAALSFTFDAVRLNNYSAAWFPINSLAFLPGVAVVVIGWYIGASGWVKQANKPWLNIAISGTAMGCKNVCTLLLCAYFGVEDSGDLWFRFIGGAGIGIGLLFLYSNLLGAKNEQDLIQRELEAKEESLLGFRENVTELFAEEEAELRKRTATELLPRLTALQEQVQSGDAKTIAQKLNAMLTEEVRPISDSLAEEAKKLQIKIPKVEIQKQPDPNVKIDLADTMRPIAASLMVFMAWLMASQIVLPNATALDILLAAITYLISLGVIKFLTKPIKQLNRNQIFIWSSFPGYLASVPGYFLLYQIPHDDMGKVLLPTFLVFGGLTNIVFCYALILERGRKAVESRLKEVVQNFEVENKLFEQKLWVAKHAWYTLLHGEVQSALTAASIRAASKSEMDATDRGQIAQDLARASKALANPSNLQVNLFESLEALQQTWLGIIEIKLQVAPEASEKIGKSFELPIVINEILKEAVTNAVRHGGAKNMFIEIDLLETGNLQIVARNDGASPVAKTADGVGSKIFSTLCMSTSLTWDEDSNQTLFQAIVPVA